MKSEDYPYFCDLMKDLKRNFKGEIDKEKINLYFENLKKYRIHAVKRGIDFIIATRTYQDFPIIGQIVEGIKNSKHIICDMEQP